MEKGEDTSAVLQVEHTSLRRRLGSKTLKLINPKQEPVPKLLRPRWARVWWRHAGRALGDVTTSSSSSRAGLAGSKKVGRTP